jgi:hypothetical protein
MGAAKTLANAIAVASANFKSAPPFLEREPAEGITHRGGVDVQADSRQNGGEERNTYTLTV